MLFTLCVLASLQPVIAQQIEDVKIIGNIKIVTTKRDAPSLLNIEPPDYQSYKIKLRDSINNSSFDVMFFLETYNKDVYNTEDRMFYNSTNSKFICEVILNITHYGDLQILFQTPEHTFASYIRGVNNNYFKWNAFTQTPFRRNVPVLLIYKENPNENLIEKKMNKLFESFSFKNLTKKDEIVEKIKSITDSFYILSYDVLLTNKNHE